MAGPDSMAQTGSDAAAALSEPLLILFLIFRPQAIWRICGIMNITVFENDRVVEIQSLWDIPEVFIQAGAWPLAPSLGREWHIPGPATQDGVMTAARDAEHSDASCQLIIDMLDAMKRHPSQGGAEVMEMDGTGTRK